MKKKQIHIFDLKKHKSLEYLLEHLPHQPFKRSDLYILRVADGWSVYYEDVDTKMIDHQEVDFTLRGALMKMYYYLKHYRS